MQCRKTISLTSKDDAFIFNQVEMGEHGNASEVICAGLRLLEQEQLELAALRQAIGESDADVAAGRTRIYQSGQLAERVKKRLGKNASPQL